mgnify:CR=1 FL=1
MQLRDLSQPLGGVLQGNGQRTLEVTDGSGGLIRLIVATESNEVVFRVRDNGIGIPPEMLAQIFDLFTQVDGSLSRSNRVETISRQAGALILPARALVAVSGILAFMLFIFQNSSRERG